MIFADATQTDLPILYFPNTNPRIVQDAAAPSSASVILNTPPRSLLQTQLIRSVDRAWVEAVTPETMLMLAHSRTYVDQLRTRIDEAGSSVECLTAVDGSEDGAGDVGGRGGKTTD